MAEQQMSGLALLLAKRKQETTNADPIQDVADKDSAGIPASQAGIRADSIPGAKVNPLASMFKTAVAATPQPAKSAEVVEVSEDMDISDLANLEDEGVAPVAHGRGPSQFDDETPATKPTRELPEDADKSLLQFVDLIDGVYEIIGDSELLGNVIKGIMVELKAHPQYMKQVCKEDIRQWVRAMRDNMGLARIKKQEKAKPRGAGGAAKKGGKVDSDMQDAFNDLGIDFSAL